MKILLDESVPADLSEWLKPGYQAVTAQQIGWAGWTNGNLIRRAEGQFDLLITADRSMRYQQNLAGRILSILALPGNRLRSVRAMLPTILKELDWMQNSPTSFVEIPCSNDWR